MLSFLGAKADEPENLRVNPWYSLCIFLKKKPPLFRTVFNIVKAVVICLYWLR